MESNRGTLARALYTNQPDQPNELYFRKGDVLTVIEIDYDSQKGWYLCSLRGQRGLVPGNYVELIEDIYSLPTTKPVPPPKKTVSRSNSTSSCTEVTSENIPEQETYDVPRRTKTVRELVRTFSQDSSATPVTLRNNISRKAAPEPIEIKENVENPIAELEELYDVPRSQMPIYGQSLTRLRKHGASDLSLLSSNGSSVHSSSSSNSSARSSAGSDLSYSSNTNNSTHHFPSSSRVKVKAINKAEEGDGVSKQIQLCQHNQGRSNRSSIVSDSGIGVSAGTMEEDQLYDVPRSVLQSNKNNKIHIGPTTSRPQSSLSMSSGVGLSITNSDSKDSLEMSQEIYDVPRKYVNYIETKYDASPSCSKSNISLTSRQSCSSNNSSGSDSCPRGLSSVESEFCTKASSRIELGSRASLTTTTSSSSSASQSHNGYQNLPESQRVVNVGSTDDLYGVPRPSTHITSSRLTGATSMSKSASPSTTSSIEEMSRNDSRNENNSLYDVPAAYNRKYCDSTETLSSYHNELRMSSLDQSLDHLDLGASSSNILSSNHHYIDHRESSASRCSLGSDDVKILPLSPKAAVAVSEKLREEVITSITSILNHVKPKWRTKENLVVVLPELKFSATRLTLSIKDLAEFCSLSVSNAKKLGDEGMLNKFRRLLIPVVNGSQIIQRDMEELDCYMWSADRLSISHNTKNNSHNGEMSDALAQLVLCSRSLKHDVQEIANFLASNASVLFKENERNGIITNNATMTEATSLATSLIETQSSKVEDTQEDYDYVSLIPAEDSKSSLVAPVVGNNSDGANKEEKNVVETRPPLESKDQQLLEFYSAQISVVAPLLSQSISTFISSVSHNEPPEVFNVHLKYVILLAYKMLFAGDTVHRNILSKDIKNDVEFKCNELHESILSLHEASKIATKDFPKLAPIQRVLDKIGSCIKAATNVKNALFNFSLNT